MSTLRPRARSSTPDEPAPAPGRRRWLVVGGLVLAWAVIVGLSLLRPPITTPVTGLPLDDAGRAVGGAAPDRASGVMEEGAAAAPPTVVGYLPYWDQGAAMDDALGAAVLTTAAPWWYAPTAEGGVVEQHPQFTDTGDDEVRRLRQRGLRVMPTIANHRDGEWDLDVVSRIIADQATRDAHVDALAALAAERDFDGIVVDYELLRARDRDNFTAFVTALGAALHDDGRRLAVALHAQASDAGSGGHNVAQDYRAIGRAADEVHLMTYDLHWDESEPGPIAPLPWVTDVLEYATARIPAGKVLLGIGLFGYDWHDGETADDLQLAQVAGRVARGGGRQGWDAAARSPWFAYRDTDGHRRVVWYEDARSVDAKLALVDRYDLGGAFIWRLGGVPDDIWRVARQRLGATG